MSDKAEFQPGAPVRHEGANVERKWNKIRLDKLVIVSDALLAIHDASGALPEAASRKVLPELAGDLLDLAERVVNDDAFWTALPEVLVPSEADTAEALGVMEEMADKALDAEETEGILAMREEVTNRTLARDEVRAKLKAAVESCK